MVELPFVVRMMIKQLLLSCPIDFVTRVSSHHHRHSDAGYLDFHHNDNEDPLDLRRNDDGCWRLLLRSSIPPTDTSIH